MNASRAEVCTFRRGSNPQHERAAPCHRLSLTLAPSRLSRPFLEHHSPKIRSARCGWRARERPLTAELNHHSGHDLVRLRAGTTSPPPRDPLACLGRHHNLSRGGVGRGRRLARRLCGLDFSERVLLLQRRQQHKSQLRHYKFDAKNGPEIDRQVREGFVPLLEKTKGFVSYHGVDDGKGDGASLSVFKDKAGADESVRLAADYVAKNLAKLLTQKPEVIEGRWSRTP